MGKEAIEKKVKLQYLRRIRLILKSKLDERNTIHVINTWVVSPLRHGAIAITWTLDEPSRSDVMRRTLLTTPGISHQTLTQVDLYLARERVRRELIESESNIRSEKIAT